MKAGARMAGACDVLKEILERHRPAAAALSDWAKAHRFAGSGDRSAIGNIVYDALRRRRSIAQRMGGETPRALAVGAAGGALGLRPCAVAAAAADPSPYSIGELSPREVAGLETVLDDRVADDIAGDFPVEFGASLTRAFGQDLVSELRAMAERAPVGLRANTLKADRARVAKVLAKHGPENARLAPDGIVLAPASGPARMPNVEAEPAHARGLFEVQDEGSQVAAWLSGARARMQVLDLCAGAGGKTLALSAIMQNTGQIYAYDSDPLQLRPIFDRLKRAGARNVQTLAPGDEAALKALSTRFDVVLVDAPCTGSGTWRRRPDAKWRLSQRNLDTRLREQQAVLTLGSELVRPGGLLVYVTCSILPEENGDQVSWLQSTRDDFRLVPHDEHWKSVLEGPPPSSSDLNASGLLLTPARHSTDGFYIAVFRRSETSVTATGT